MKIFANIPTIQKNHCNNYEKQHGSNLNAISFQTLRANILLNKNNK